MEPNRPVEASDSSESYTPRQLLVLNLLKVIAWLMAFIAMLFIMHG